jgi:phosphoribosylanthranilate isomerase
MTYVKVCCISSYEEARLAINYGASAIGLVGKMPSGPGVISDELITEIAAKIPPGLSTFLLTSETAANRIIQHIKKVSTNTVQIVDAPETGTYDKIRTEMPWLKIVQVIHVVDEKSIEEAIEISTQVDALLLDSGNPNLKIKVLGGTGQTHNWELSRKIVEKSEVPVFLAGGLNPENVGEAIKKVRPYGVDVCSGVRTNGELDEEKMKNFLQQVYNISKF